MNDDETLDDLARSLAAGSDIASIMAVRADIIALICDAVGDDPGLRRRARKLRRNAELVIGEMLIEMRALGLRRTEGGNHRQDSRPTLSQLGLQHERSERWQARARANAKPRRSKAMGTL